MVLNVKSSAILKKMIKMFCFVVLSITILGLNNMAYSAENNPLLFTAEKTEEIVSWGKSRHGDVSTELVQYNGKKIFVLLGDTGFGLIRLNVYVYSYSPFQKKWVLLHVSFTNTSQVSVEYNENNPNIRFLSKAGNELFTISLNAINLDLIPSKQ